MKLRISTFRVEKCIPDLVYAGPKFQLRSFLFASFLSSKILLKKVRFEMMELFFTFSRKPSFLFRHLLMHPRRVERHLHRVDMADSVSADNSRARNIRRCQSFLRHFCFYRFRNAIFWFHFFRFWIFEHHFRRRLAALFRRVESEIGVGSRRIGKRRFFVKSLKRPKVDA